MPLRNWPPSFIEAADWNNLISFLGGSTSDQQISTTKILLSKLTTSTLASWESPITNGLIDHTKLDAPANFPNEAANLVFAGPSSGAAAQPSFRPLVAADIPTALNGTTFSGNVGIGTASPGVPLDVISNTVLAGIRIQTASQNEATIEFLNTNTGGRKYQLFSTGGSSGLGQGKFAIYDSTGAATRLAIDSTGNIGIGTASPDAPLTVLGPTTLTNSPFIRMGASLIAVGDQELISCGDSPGGTINYVQFGAIVDAGASMSFVVYTKNASGSTAPSERMRILGSGNVGIGTTSPGYLCDVAGSAHASSFPTSSDQRFKSKVEAIYGAMDLVRQLQGVYFEWSSYYTETLGRHGPSGRLMGLLAQDVEQVCPEVVTWFTQTDKAGNVIASDFRSVDYGRLIPLIINALKEQDKRLGYCEKMLGLGGEVST